jgi:hypothetical protein
MIHIDWRVSAKALTDGYGILLHAYFIVRLGPLGCLSFDKEITPEVVAVEPRSPCPGLRHRNRDYVRMQALVCEG